MSDSLERVICEFIAQGDANVQAAADRVKADLTSVERAGRSAERATNDASASAERANQAARQMASEISRTLGKLQLAVSVAQRAASVLSPGLEDSPGFRFASSALSGGSQGAQLGATVGGAPGAILGGLLGAGLGGASALQEIERRTEAAAERGAARARGLSDDDVDGWLLREAGLSKLGALTRGPREQQY